MLRVAFPGLVYLVFSVLHARVFITLGEVFFYDLIKHLAYVIDLGFFSLIFSYSFALLMVSHAHFLYVPFLCVFKLFHIIYFFLTISFIFESWYSNSCLVHSAFKAFLWFSKWVMGFPISSSFQLEFLLQCFYLFIGFCFKILGSFYNLSALCLCFLSITAAFIFYVFLP